MLVRSNDRLALRQMWLGLQAQAKIAEVATSILLATKRGHAVTYCEVSPAEYLEICKEHVGGPWLGKMEICGVPIRVRHA